MLMLVRSFAAHDKGVLSISVAPKASSSSTAHLVCSGSYDGTIKLWRLDEGDDLKPPSLQCTIDDNLREDGPVFSVCTAAADGGRLLLCAGKYSRRVRTWHATIDDGGGSVLKPHFHSALHSACEGVERGECGALLDLL